MQAFIARHVRIALPALSLVVLLSAVFYMQPRAMSYVGLNLLLNLALPIAFATIAQMFVITVNELDLSIGSYVGFVACVGATWLRDDPLLGVAALAGGIAGLCRGRRADPSAQAAVHRRHARHVVRLAGARHPRAADAGRQGAGMAARDHDLEDPAAAVHDLRLDRAGGDRAFRR